MLLLLIARGLGGSWFGPPLWRCIELKCGVRKRRQYQTGVQYGTCIASAPDRQVHRHAGRAWEGLKFRCGLQVSDFGCGSFLVGSCALARLVGRTWLADWTGLDWTGLDWTVRFLLLLLLLLRRREVGDGTQSQPERPQCHERARRIASWLAFPLWTLRAPIRHPQHRPRRFGSCTERRVRVPVAWQSSERSAAAAAAGRPRVRSARRLKRGVILASRLPACLTVLTYSTSHAARPVLEMLSSRPPQ